MSNLDSGYDESNEEIIIYKKFKENIKVTFDVGAREDLYFYEVHPDCSYHLFEPHKEFFDNLKKKVDDLAAHDITLNNYGLSSRDREEHIYYPNVQSFIPHWCVHSPDVGIRYPLKTIDGYIIEHKIEHIDFLKTDVEGLDYQVLRGAEDALENNKISCIQFEACRDPSGRVPRSGITRFCELLAGKYDMYFLMEPVLLDKIKSVTLTTEQSGIDYDKGFVELDQDIIELYDGPLYDAGCGANVLCIHKDYKEIYKL